MDIRANGSAPSRRAPADWFTGTVWQEPVIESPAPGNVRATYVHFEPGGRTNWHTHPAGQTRSCWSCSALWAGPGLSRVLGRGRHVYAIGDCADPEGTGKQLFTHVAGMHAALLIRKLVFRLPGRLPATPPVRVVYTEPELAQVGHRDGHRVLEQKFDENDRAVAEGETTGLVRLVLDRRGRLIGAGITCPGAGEMIGLYALAIAQRTKLSALAGLVLPYPTRSQAGTRAAAAYFAARLFTAGPRRLAGLLKRLP